MKNIKTKKMYLLLSGIILILALSLYYSSRTTHSPQTSKSSKEMSFFITSKNKGAGGNLGGLVGADAYCTALAEASGVYGKTWVAYLSSTAGNNSPAINARERIGDGPWYNYNGELIANTIEELHTNNFLSKTTAITENGVIVNGRGDTPNEHDILTGSDSDGNLVATTTDTTCSNWTSSNAGAAYVGHHDRIGTNDSAPMKSWNSSHLTRGCSLEALKATGGAGLYYCFAK
jgi:hypothetical protein